MLVSQTIALPVVHRPQTFRGPPQPCPDCL